MLRKLLAIGLLSWAFDAAGAAEQCPPCLPPPVDDPVLSGQVVDEQGRPVPGVEVWPYSPYGAEPVAAVTGPDGHFSLPRHFESIMACPAGFQAAQVNFIDLPGGPLRIALRRAGRIAGRVVDERGAPVARARVSASIPRYREAHFVCTNGARVPPCPTEMTGFSTETDREGRFTSADVTPGWYVVRVWKNVDLHEKPIRARATAGQTAEIEIVADPAAVLQERALQAPEDRWKSRGRALDPAGRTGEVVARVLTDGMPVPAVLYAEREGSDYFTADTRMGETTGADATYRIFLPDAERWNITARVGTWSATTTRAVAPGERVEIDFHKPPTVSVSGWLRPFWPETVRISFGREGHAFETATGVNESGRFLADLADGPWRIRAHSSRGQADQQIVIAGAAIDGINLHLVPGTSLDGSISGLDWGEIAERVTARDPDSFSVEGTIDPETGAYHFQDLGAGPWTITAQAGTKKASEEVTIAPRETAARLDIEFDRPDEP